MAKRKAARAGGRKAAARKGAAKKAARRTARAGARTAPRKSAARKGAAKRGASRKAPARKTAAKKAKQASRKSVARKATARKATAPRAPAPKAPARTPPAARKQTAAKTVPVRRAPALDRERRRIADDEDLVMQTPPSSLDLDRTASAVRTGRRGLRDRYAEHTETSPAMTAGDVDADWESAYAVGDEAPGGDNPTPDQDIVDDIGKAVGVEYQDNEELKGETKLLERDKHRWELDPASSEDYDDRD